VTRAVTPTVSPTLFELTPEVGFLRLENDRSFDSGEGTRSKNHAGSYSYRMGGGRSLVSRKVTTSGLLLFYLCCKKWSFVVLQSFLGRLSYRKTTKQEDPKKIMKKRQMEWVEMLSSE
jgi:hypothetical protein